MLTSTTMHLITLALALVSLTVAPAVIELRKNSRPFTDANETTHQEKTALV